jgi:hypothetical protein
VAAQKAEGTRMRIEVRKRNAFKTTKKKIFNLPNFFFLDFSLSQLTSLQFILYHVARFYKPNIPQSPPLPPYLQDYSIRNNDRLEFSTNFVPTFDPNERCMKNSFHSGGFNLGPLGLESSALTTRPQLLAYTIAVFFVLSFSQDF